MIAKTLEQVSGIVANIVFMDRKFIVTAREGGFLLQLEYMEPDVDTGVMAKQRARKWYVSKFSTETEIVETAFKACRVSMDHVLKEHFTYEGFRVYSPHFNVRARMLLAEARSFDGRDSATSVEVLPGLDSDWATVNVQGLQVGLVKQVKVDDPKAGWIGVTYAEGLGAKELHSPTLASKSDAARWVEIEARDKSWFQQMSKALSRSRAP